MFVHISHGTDHKHRLLMPLRMANLMAEDHDVLVYFDVDGVNAVFKDAPDVKMERLVSPQRPRWIVSNSSKVS